MPVSGAVAVGVPGCVGFAGELVQELWYQQFQARFGVEAMLESFGQTETGLTLLCPYGEQRPRGTVGKPLPGTRGKPSDRRI